MLVLLRALELLALLGYYYLLSFGLVYSTYVRKGGYYALLVFIIGSVITGPVFLILFNLFGVTISKVNFVFLLGLTLIVNIWLSLYSKKRKDLMFDPQGKLLQRKYITLVFFLLIGLSRIIQIDMLYVPNWIDGYNNFQDASRLLLSRSLISQHYHIGFVLSALFDYRLLNWLGQSHLADIILVSGQKFSILACVAFYLLAYRISNHEFAALFSTILYSFWAPFPSYLISWGRYPFLSGLSLLPLVFLFLLEPKEQRLNYCFLILTFTALLFYHYSALLFAIFILIAKIILDLFEEKKEAFWKLMFLCLIIGIVCTKLYVSYHYRDTLFLDLSYTISENASDDIGHIFLLTWINGGFIVWIIGFIAMISSFVKRSKLNNLLSLTLGLTILFYIAQFLILHGFIFGFDNFVITLPLFLSMYSISFIDRLLMIKSTPKFGWIILIGFSLLGFNNSLRIVNPITILFTQADQVAFTWLVQNTSPDTIIYINSFRWKNRYVPSDGGAWIENLLGRKTIFAKSEEEISNLNVSIRKQSPEYIYLSGGLGELNVSKINSSQSFKLVYHQDNVNIFRILELP